MNEFDLRIQHHGQELRELYAKSEKTQRDKDIFNALAAMMGVGDLGL